MGRWSALLALLVATAATADTCEPADSLMQLPKAQIVLKNAAGTRHNIMVRVAAEPLARATGFQGVCPDAIRDMAILFIFPRQYFGSFHMHNVLAPLDIVFADESGQVLAVKTMALYQPGQTSPTYEPGGPFVYALEAAAGRLRTLLGGSLGGRLLVPQGAGQ
ncbi:MAG: DUF192 domain-containing protein [Arenicellales bacterium]|jgi:uncharacterized membrane protein (UPF0127 family)|nr:DUF192 domain-containing protein [Arenicellales bacterium]MDP6949282.1 DUF192 domain-containing protein [Arenicellales bacterium]|tara:strand:- start:133 stop:621 length:489 start_codon:yes stop_codon:yes gene_type:complete